MDVARDDQELLVVTENGFGKRTPVERVPQDLARRQGRADDQVLREARRPRRRRSSSARTRSCVFISQEGMVQRTGVRGIRQHRPRGPGRDAS